MKIDRRNLLWATASLAMATLVGPTSSKFSLAGSDEFPWHPFTRSLLDRARQASSVDGRADDGVRRFPRGEQARTMSCGSPLVARAMKRKLQAL